MVICLSVRISSEPAFSETTSGNRLRLGTPYGGAGQVSWIRQAHHKSSILLFRQNAHNAELATKMNPAPIRRESKLNRCGAKYLIYKELGGEKECWAELDAGRFLKIFLIFWFLRDFFVFLCLQF